jgi:hypothetical protein
MLGWEATNQARAKEKKWEMGDNQWKVTAKNQENLSRNQETKMNQKLSLPVKIRAPNAKKSELQQKEM